MVIFSPLYSQSICSFPEVDVSGSWAETTIPFSLKSKIGCFVVLFEKIEKNIKKHQKNLDLKGFLTTQGILDFIKKSQNAINNLS